MTAGAAVRCRLPRWLCAATALAFAGFAPAALGQPVTSLPDAGAAVCLPERTQNAALTQKLAAAEALQQEQAARIEQLGAQLEEGSRQAKALHQSLDTTRAQLDNACHSTDALVESVMLSTPIPAGAQACVAPEHAQALLRFEQGLGNAVSALDALQAFSAGETDRPPRAPKAETEMEAAVARLLGEGHGVPPLVYRRLLAEAVRRVAPSFWTKLQARPGRAASAWLQSDSPMDPALIGEVRRGAEDGPSGGAPTTTVLLHGLELTRAFRELAGCQTSTRPVPGCERAGQLESLLETSSPLLIGRREESIWATDCQVMSATTVRGWFADLPGNPRLARADWSALEGAAYAKLFGCFLDSPSADASFGAWLSEHMPSAAEVTGPQFDRILGVRARFVAGGEEDRCARAVRALQEVPAVDHCALDKPALQSLRAWHPGAAEGGSLALDTCSRFAKALWQGKAAKIPAAFGRPPERSDMVRIAPGEGGLAHLRALCEDRRGGPEQFPSDLKRLVEVAVAWGEDPVLPPWRANAGDLVPREQVRFDRAGSLWGWVRGLTSRKGTCGALGLSNERCMQCLAGGTQPGRYDCVLRGALRTRWDRWNANALALLLLFGLGLLGLVWGRRLTRERRRFGGWLASARAAFERAGLSAAPRPLRLLFPRRYRTLSLSLPSTPDWERWGKRAVVVRAQRGALSAREVDEAAALARGEGAGLALLVHDVGASPALGAVRSILDWAVRGAQAVQVLPVDQARLEWVRSPGDLLDLVEQTSLRGNPFEVRGRITSASQFFDRERLVSGLLASVQAGAWTLITGLRRMGKSSVALEVARQLNGPSAYVDFAGFHHEMAYVDRDVAATAVLRYLCLRLAESAKERSGVQLPPLPEGDLDSSRLAEWFAALGRACLGSGAQRGGYAVVIFDELEQAIGVGAGRVERALDVLATVLGRLRTALGEPSRAGPGRVGVLLCGAIHPLLWSPLAPLAGGSLMSALPRVVVNRLDDDAAASMMRGLGARQGIRFTEEALELMIREAQGIPLLVRRLGSSVLELYDPERARQGGLGAVEVGLEGAAAAVRREEDEGAPLRVWVDSEIGDPQSPAGRVLRRLAAEGTASATELRELARVETRRQLEASGALASLPPSELDRRAEEASSTVLQLLTETGLVMAEGDLTRPERYVLPDGLLRRILNRAQAPGPFELP